jgi:hypothetical protein
MQASETATLADRRVYRLTDLQGSLEAAAALKASAAAAPTDSDTAAAVLRAASAVLGDGLQRADEPVDDATRDRLRDAATSPEFLSKIPAWVRELREVASSLPQTGACTTASALELWAWTALHLSAAPRALDDLADSLVGLLAARSFALEVAGASASAADAGLREDLCHVQSARAASAAGAVCASLVFGYRRHLAWDAEGCATCYSSDQLDDLEVLMPGIISGASAQDVIEADGSHPKKAGPCVRLDGLEPFFRLRNKLDGCLTGARLSRDRAAVTIARSMDAMFPGERK